MSEIVYLNGRLVKIDEAGIEPTDQGFLFGAGLFETMRAYNGCIFLLGRHIKRLISSAHVLGIAEIDSAGLEEACRSVISANRLASARVRLTVSRGTSNSFPPTSGPPTILVQAQVYEPPASEKYRTGYRAALSAHPRYSRSMLVRHKTTNYLECLLARSGAVSQGNDEALFINESGNLTEGSASNIFLIDPDGKLITPPLDAGLLPGITRLLTLEMATKKWIEVIEKHIRQVDLRNFRVAFITSSLIEIMPLASINDPDGTKYSFDHRDLIHGLQEAYHEAVVRETGRHD